MVQVQDWGSGYLPGAGSKLGILGRDEVPESKNKGFLINKLAQQEDYNSGKLLLP